MLITYLFILSGAGLVTLLIAKRLEEKRKTKPVILELISRGDEVFRELHHNSIHWYSSLRINGEFFIKKQIPMKSRSSLNKCLALIQEKTENYFDGLRDSKLLKKSEGISDFFKTMSSVEKGKGEIFEEDYAEENIEEIVLPEPEKTSQEHIEVRFEVVEPSTTSSPVMKKSRAKRVPRKVPVARRKLKVTSEETE